ncbi:MAG TPA: pilus assembly protein TadG-related protein [Acidimicrobiia bacterium]|jgi:Flp pilus assembly protein TadG
MQLMSRLTSRARRTREDEQGFFLVFFTLALVMLLAIAGLAVDFANWTYQGQQEQKVADAAALAGAVFLPDNPTAAKNAAWTTASQNGYSNAEVDPEPGSGSNADKMTVTITRTVTNVFASVIGFHTKTITRTATAEYQKPIAMGSPTNQFGNDPTCGGQHGSTCYPDFWANVAGRNSTKISGDRYTAGVCTDSPDRCPFDYATAADGGDYDSFGHVFAINVKQSGTYRVQVFDPAFVHVGDHCDQADADLNGIASEAARFGLSPTTYAPGPTNLSCTGDNLFGSAGSEPTTVYTVRSPGPLPPTASTSPPVTGCTNITFTGISGDLQQHFDRNDLPPTGMANPPGFRGYFRQWVPICQFSASSAGTYYLQVQSPTGNGHNRFAVKVTGGAAGAVAVYGDQHMAIYANAPSANTTFYLARVPSAAANHVLVVDLFDIGDAASTGTLTILPPSEVGGSFANCTFQKGVGGSVNPVSGCSIGGVSSSNGYNGKLDEFRIPIPSTYQCNDASTSGCWLKINLSFGGDVEDTTTWSAQLLGDPVRIVQ